MERTASHLTWHIMESSTVQAVAYDPIERSLYVEFKRGATYKYKDVTGEDYADVIGVDSIGAHIAVLTKNFDYEEVTK